MTKEKKFVDMLNGPLVMKILLFALPLAASSILQQLFNAADVAVVGRFAGQEALAAVGANSPIVALFINSFIGLAVGVNVVIAQYIGRGLEKKVEAVVHTAILTALILGVALLVLGMIIARPIHAAIGTPTEVVDQAMLYLRIYYFSMPFATLYNFGAAILRSVGDTKRPMVCLILSGVLNVLLNLLLVIGFRMGVAGVAIATALSNVVSAVLILGILIRENSMIHLQISALRIEKASLVQILRIGVPASIQSMVFSFSNVCIQSGINSFGTAAIAGSAAAVNFEIFDYFMVNSFNQAGVTFVGQNYAAGKFDRCKRVYGICMSEALIAVALMVTVFMIGKTFWIGLYSQDEAVLDYAFRRMGIALIPQFLVCTYEITGSILRGMGRSLLPAVLTVLGSVCFRVCWLLTVFRQWNSYETLMKVYPASWILTGSMMIIAYLVTRRSNYSLQREEKIL